MCLISACYTMSPEFWGQIQGQSQAGSLDQTQLPCSPSWFSPTPLTLEHLENGQRVIETWGRFAECWMGLGHTHTDEISSLMPLPQVLSDMMAWPWLSCLLLPALMVSGGCLPSLGTLGRTLQMGGAPSSANSFYDPALCLAALGRSGEGYRPRRVSWAEGLASEVGVGSHRGTWGSALQ